MLYPILQVEIVMSEAAIVKQCRTCGLTKDISDFYKNSSSPDGYRSTCKVCFNRNRNKTGTDGTKSHTPIASGVFSPDKHLLDTERDVPGGYGTQLKLTIPEFNYVMHDTGLCPACNNYDVRFKCFLEDGFTKIPIVICNSCTLKTENDLVRFYTDNKMIYIIRVYPIHSLPE